MLLFPSVGTELAKAAEETPGMAGIFRRISWMHADDALGLFHLASGMKTASVCNSRGFVNPGWTCRNAWKVRIIRPELISRITASAICSDHQRVARAMRLFALAYRSSPGAKRGGHAGRGIFEHGHQSKQQAGASERARVNSSTRGSMVMFSRRGRYAGAILTRRRSAQ